MYIPGWNVRQTAPYGLLILRVVLGIAFAVHGWSKLSGGPANMIGFFGSAGIPAPALLVWIVTMVELVGGIFLIVGFLTQIVGVLLAIDMLGAIVFVRMSSPFIEQGAISWEREAVFGAAALCLALAGAGAFSVDETVSESRADIDTRSRVA
jgi:putative oxidoreductase